MSLSSRGKVILGYNEIELCMKGSGYNFVHAADMMYCADNHVRSKFLRPVASNRISDLYMRLGNETNMHKRCSPSRVQ